MAKKSNWMKLKNRTYMETAQGRDVYGEQQMDRGKLQEKQSFFFRGVLCVLVGIFTAVAVYVLWAMMAPVITQTREVLTRGTVMESPATEDYNSDTGGDGSAGSGSDMLSQAITQSSATAGDSPQTQFEALSSYSRTENLNDDGSVNSVDIHDSSGKKLATELYENGEIRRVDVYDAVGNVIRQEIVHNGVVQKAGNYDSEFNLLTVQYYENKKVTHVEAYEGKKVSTDTYYDDNGQVVRIDRYESGRPSTREIYENGQLKSTEKINPFLYPQSSTQVIVSLLAGLMAMGIMYPIMRKNLDAQNMLADTEDINQYTNDQHIALPEEIQQKFDWFPDVGATSDVLVSSMISHIALKNKGVKTVNLSKRYKKDVVDENGQVAHYKGEIIYDEDGNPEYDAVPMFDAKFTEALYEASNAPEEVRMSYDPRFIPYNKDNKNREKLQGKEPSTAFTDKMIAKLFRKDIKKVSKYDTVSDLINKDWEFPYYEPQRPAGAYLVDTAPVNTMV